MQKYTILLLISGLRDISVIRNPPASHAYSVVSLIWLCVAINVEHYSQENIIEISQNWLSLNSQKEIIRFWTASQWQKIWKDVTKLCKLQSARRLKRVKGNWISTVVMSIWHIKENARNKKPLKAIGGGSRVKKTCQAYFVEFIAVISTLFTECQNSTRRYDQFNFGGLDFYIVQKRETFWWFFTIFASKIFNIDVETIKIDTKMQTMDIITKKSWSWNIWKFWPKLGKFRQKMPSITKMWFI